MPTGQETVVNSVLRHTIKHGSYKGREITIGSIGIKEMGSARQAALVHYKREKIEGVCKNLDLLPEDQRDAMRQEAFRDANRIEIDDLPDKTAKEPLEKDGEVLKGADGNVQTQKRTFDYPTWWSSFHPDGQLFNIWQSMNKHGGEISLLEISDIFSTSPEDLTEVVDIIGELSNPTLLGNGEAPQAEGPEEKRRRRRRRRK